MSGEQYLPIILDEWRTVSTDYTSMGIRPGHREEHDMIDIQQIEASINPQNYAQIGFPAGSISNGRQQHRSG